jgi:hypothetical protein
MVARRQLFPSLAFNSIKPLFSSCYTFSASSLFHYCILSNVIHRSLILNALCAGFLVMFSPIDIAERNHLSLSALDPMAAVIKITEVFSLLYGRY